MTTRPYPLRPAGRPQGRSSSPGAAPRSPALPRGPARRATTSRTRGPACGAPQPGTPGPAGRPAQRREISSSSAARRRSFRSTAAVFSSGSLSLTMKVIHTSSRVPVSAWGTPRGATPILSFPRLQPAPAPGEGTLRPNEAYLPIQFLVQLTMAVRDRPRRTRSIADYWSHQYDLRARPASFCTWQCRTLRSVGRRHRGP